MWGGYRKDWADCSTTSAVHECQFLIPKVGGYKQKRPYTIQHNNAQNRIRQTGKWRTDNPHQCHLSILSWGGVDDSLITKSCVDYAEVPIPKDSVIYCDIPYMNTEGYPRQGGFDYERFYQWAEQQAEPVFISSYWMPPERFDVVAEFDHRCTVAQKANNKVTERIFIPKHQKERGNTLPQPSLYDLMSM